VLRKMRGPKRNGVTGEWRRLSNEFHDVCTPHQILLELSDQDILTRNVYLSKIYQPFHGSKLRGANVAVMTKLGWFLMK